LNIKVIG